MIEATVNDYQKYVQFDTAKHLLPIEESIDNMLTRLEEFESMVTIVQQESGNIIGLTGTFSQINDQKSHLDQMCCTIDVLECMVVKVRHTIESLEDKVEQAEEQYGYLENNYLKSLFKQKMFKKTPHMKNNLLETPFPTLNISEYFKQPK